MAVKLVALLEERVQAFGFLGKRERGVRLDADHIRGEQFLLRIFKFSPGGKSATNRSANFPWSS